MTNKRFRDAISNTGTKNMNRTAAQIVFLQASEHKWIGRLLNPSAAYDTQYEGHSLARIGNDKARAVITEDAETGRCSLMVQGGAVGGRRYSTHDDLTTAQIAAIKWCGRRFKIVGDGR